MTREEAVAKLKAIPNGDTEGAHGDADDILLEFLKDNGFEDVAKSWSDVADRHGGFWYA